MFVAGGRWHAVSSHHSPRTSPKPQIPVSTDATLDTLMGQDMQGDCICLELHQVHGWASLARRPAFSFFDWETELVWTALPHTSPPARHWPVRVAKILTVSAITQVCALARDIATANTLRWPTSSTKHPRKRVSIHKNILHRRVDPSR